MQADHNTSPTTRRLGRFRIAGVMLKNRPVDVLRVMGKCIVVRAEYLYEADAIEYTAISEHFAPLPEGFVVPTYRWVFQSDGHLICE